MNIAFCDGMLLQVVLHGGKATVLSKREIGADTINFYNYFARYCLSPEEPLLKLLNCADDEAIEIISGQPLVKQFCWDSSSSCTDALTQRNQATAKEALTYTRNLTQQAFSELDAVFSEFHDTKGPDGSKVVFMPKQVITTFALLNNKIVQVYSVKDLYDYLSIDFYYANYASESAKRIAICPCCKRAFRLSQRNKVYCSKACKDKSIRVNNKKDPCPKAAAMWSGKNAFTPSEVAATSSKKAVFVCHDCGQEFEVRVRNVVHSVMNGRTGCPVCAGQKVVPGINDLASKYPEAAAMWSSKNKLSASEVAVKSNQKAFFKCRDCGQEFEASICNVVRAVSHDCTGCYDCAMRKSNAISKPEWFYTRLMLAFAGESGIPNPFFDARCILGENSFMGLDFVDHIQKLIYEYNGNAWHGNDEHAAKDRFKFEAARKAGYAMIRVLEPGLEVLDPKYDIVMPEGFGHHGKYDTEIMEEVGRKVIHLLEEIYGRKASPEIWALNNFKEFEVWYDANKKELEANARKKGPKGKTAAKMAA